MEQANRIVSGGSGRWKVITLAGQVIDTVGTMSGGGERGDELKTRGGYGAAGGAAGV